MAKRRPRRVRIGIVGSRGYPDLKHVECYVRDIYRQCTEKGIEVEFVSGGAHGVDEVAIDTAQSIGAKWKVLKPDWRVKKKMAGMLRNTLVADYVDHLVAFWDGYSPGTEDVMAKADVRGKLKRVFNAEDEYVHDPMEDEQAENEGKPGNCGVQSSINNVFSKGASVWGCTKAVGHEPPHGHPWAGHTW